MEHLGILGELLRWLSRWSDLRDFQLLEPLMDYGKFITQKKEIFFLLWYLGEGIHVWISVTRYEYYVIEPLILRWGCPHHDYSERDDIVSYYISSHFGSCMRVYIFWNSLDKNEPHRWSRNLKRTQSASVSDQENADCICYTIWEGIVKYPRLCASMLISPDRGS